MQFDIISPITNKVLPPFSFQTEPHFKQKFIGMKLTASAEKKQKSNAFFWNNGTKTHQKPVCDLYPQ